MHLNGQMIQIDISQRRNKNAYKYMKKTSISFVNRETKIKTIMRYDFTSVRMFIIKKSTQFLCSGSPLLMPATWELIIGGLYSKVSSGKNLARSPHLNQQARNHGVCL
jgi:hypothetical protein